MLGHNSDGQAEDLHLTELPTVDQTEFRSGSVGGAHTCVRDGRSRLLCWGLDNWGQVRDSGRGVPLAARPDVYVLSTGGGRGFRQFSAGLMGTLTVADAGSGNRIRTWGYPFETGDPKYAPPRGVPRRVSLGVSHACMITDRDELKCWGLAGPLIDEAPVIEGECPSRLTEPGLGEFDEPVEHGEWLVLRRYPPEFLELMRDFDIEDLRALTEYTLTDDD